MYWPLNITEQHGTEDISILLARYGQKSQLSKPSSLCISWDSSDLSSAASRRFISRSSVPVRARQWWVYSPWKDIWIFGNLNKTHFLVTGSWVGVLSVVSRPSVGKMRRGTRGIKVTAILRNSTFGQKLHLKVNFRTICLQMCNFCCNFATDFGIEACYLPIS